MLPMHSRAPDGKVTSKVFIEEAMKGRPVEGMGEIPLKSNQKQHGKFSRWSAPGLAPRFEQARRKQRPKRWSGPGRTGREEGGYI